MSLFAIGDRNRYRNYLRRHLVGHVAGGCHAGFKPHCRPAGAENHSARQPRLLAATTITGGLR